MRERGNRPRLASSSRLRQQNKVVDMQSMHVRFWSICSQRILRHAMKGKSLKIGKEEDNLKSILITVSPVLSKGPSMAVIAAAHGMTSS